MRVLFLCGKNRCRSPTAEAVFRVVDGVEADSAGVRPDADTVVTGEHVEWAELIVVMEQQYGRVLRSKFSRLLKDKRVVSVDIKDEWEFMDPGLVSLLQRRVTPLLR